MIVSAGHDKFARVWRLSDGVEVRKAGPVQGGSVAVTPDGRCIVAQSTDSRIASWDLTSVERLCKLGMHWTMVNALAVTPDGRRVISAGDDKLLRVWDLELAMAWRNTEGHPGRVGRIIVAPNGRTAFSVCAGCDLRAWDLGSGSEIRCVRVRPNWPADIALTPNGRRLVTTTFGESSIEVWELEGLLATRDPRPSLVLESEGEDYSEVAVTADGRRAVCAEYENLVIHNLQQGEETMVLEGHEYPIRALALPPDGRTAVTGADDWTVRVWDLDAGAERRTLPFSGLTRALAVSPDGRYVAAGSDRGVISIRDIETGDESATLSANSEAIWTVAFARGGTMVVSGSRDGTVRVWDPKQGRCVASHDTGETVTACAVAPVNDAIVAGDDSGRVHFLELVPAMR
jgi:WD40 repeat protein